MQCKAVYLCERCWAPFSVDVEPVDTGRERKEIFVRQVIIHDCPGGGTGRAFFLGFANERKEN